RPSAWPTLQMAFLPSAALLPLALLLVPTLPSQAQVSMGYNNPITSTATRARTAFQAIRNTRVFEVEGTNAVPNDGSLVYNESTIWNVLNPADPFSLNVNSFDPLAEFQQKNSRRDDVRVQRIEAVSATVSGPLSTTQPADPRDWVRPRESALPAPLLSVFAADGGP
ncbi:MAG: hypothetical protein ACK54Z_03395, partial [Cyanobacteriota bacterium]